MQYYSCDQKHWRVRALKLEAVSLKERCNPLEGTPSLGDRSSRIKISFGVRGGELLVVGD